ncbi:VOC family protein [Angustibacter sp. McL0619]|uniref:VOC family protein n=1 Tax=Angustibacter sp. McL0619 TaxID=3415676 RepID=UPI003CF982FD
MDLRSGDPARSREFYGSLFGWEAHETAPEFNDYVNFSLDGVMAAGMVANDPAIGQPDGWTTYFAATNAVAIARTIVAEGGQVPFGPHPVADIGLMAYAIDLAGAPFGLWQDLTGGREFAQARPGAASYHELHTNRYADVVAFYAKVFGRPVKAVGDTDEFRYSQLMADDATPVAGIMDFSTFAPDVSEWFCYFGSADVDATIEQVERLGGAVLEPAMDTPYGRLATVSDPTGAVFKLTSLPG